MSDTDESSSRVCLFCFKSTQNPFLDETDGDGISERTIKFTRVLNTFTNYPPPHPEEIKNGEDNHLVKILSENSKVLNYCSNCDTIIDQLCDIYEQIKSLEKQFECKLDDLGEIINYANKVPSRWLNVKEHFEDAAAQSEIREFRQNVVKAAQNRKQNGQPPRISLKRPVNPSDNLSESTESKKTKLEDKPTAYLVLPEQCPKCPMKLKDKRTLSVHLSHHKADEQPVWECSECGRQFSRHSSYNIHKKSHSSGDKPFKCQFCDQRFIYLQPLKRHLRTEHGYQDETDETSEESSDPFPVLPQEIAQNQAVIIKQEPADALSNFEDENNMDGDDFNGDAEYWWENTSTISSFIKPEVEEEHPPTQSTSKSGPPKTKSKPIYECEICTRKFQAIFHKERHFKTSHDLKGKPEDLETFKCEVENCSAYFLRKWQLNEHYTKLHQISAKFGEGEERRNMEYKCKKCGRKFVNQVAFLAHIRELRTTSCMTFECRVCGEKFKYLLKLNEHLSREHGNEVVFNYQLEGKVRGEGKDNCLDGKTGGKGGQVVEGQVVDEVDYLERNGFGRKGECGPTGNNLAELEDLD